VASHIALFHVTGWHPVGHPERQSCCAMILRLGHENFCTELTFSSWKHGSHLSDTTTDTERGLWDPAWTHPSTDDFGDLFTCSWRILAYIMKSLS